MPIIISETKVSEHRSTPKYMMSTMISEHRLTPLKPIMIMISKHRSIPFDWTVIQKGIIPHVYYRYHIINGEKLVIYWNSFCEREELEADIFS